jgi:hypothetical protein
LVCSEHSLTTNSRIWRHNGRWCAAVKDGPQQFHLADFAMARHAAPDLSAMWSGHLTEWGLAIAEIIILPVSVSSFFQPREQFLLNRCIFELVHFGRSKESFAARERPEFFVQVGELGLIIFNILVGSLGVVLGSHL